MRLRNLLVSTLLADLHDLSPSYLEMPPVVDYHHIQIRLHVTLLGQVLRTLIKEHDSFHITSTYSAKSSLHVKMVGHLLTIKQTY